MAAHGEEVTWYFRHETRQTYDQVIDSCDFSLWAALVLLGRQQLSSAAFFQTPHYVIADGGRPETWRLPPRIVTEARALTPTSVEIEVSAQGTKFDALMTIEGFQLGILLLHRSKPKPDLAHFSKGQHRLGIVAIDVEELWAEVMDSRPEKGASKAALVGRFLLGSVRSKSWLFHPKEIAAREKIEADVRTLRGAEEQRDGRWLSLREFVKLDRPQPYRRFHCIFCKITWDAIDVGRVLCPKCNELSGVSRREVLPPPESL